MQIGTVTF